VKKYVNHIRTKRGSTSPRTKEATGKKIETAITQEPANLPDGAHESKQDVPRRQMHSQASQKKITLDATAFLPATR
jgi:hypothetical protein